LCRGLEAARKKEAAISGGSILSFTQEAEILLQMGRNARELAVERGADRIDRRNDHDRDTGGDQAVFNRSRTRLVLENANSLDIRRTPSSRCSTSCSATIIVNS
jgi:hypothetical protein